MGLCGCQRAGERPYITLDHSPAYAAALLLHPQFRLAGKTAFKSTSDQCKMPATLSTNLRTNHNPLVAEEEEEETDFCAAGDEEAPSKTGKRRV